MTKYVKLSLTEEGVEKIEQYRERNNLKTITAAIYDLIQKGFVVSEGEAPQLSDQWGGPRDAETIERAQEWHKRQQMLSQYLSDGGEGIIDE